jgi:cytochrome c oxidase assembly factor CtaG
LQSFVAVHSFAQAVILCRSPWGFAPLEDQQFGGALMWTVGGLILAGFVLYGIARLLVSLEAAKAS